MGPNRLFIPIILLGGLLAVLVVALPTLRLTYVRMDNAPSQTLAKHPMPLTPPNQIVSPQIVTGLQPTYSFAKFLTEGTILEVLPLTPANIRMGAQRRYLDRHEAKVQLIANQAVAAISIRSVWPGDPIFPTLRAHNFRIVEIDACTPIEPDRRGVALVEDPQQSDRDKKCKSHSPYVWLGIGNATRMAEIMAHDLARLQPDQTSKLLDNLARLKRDLFAIRADYQIKFADLDNLEAIALCADFVYLTAEMQIDVIDYRLKSEIHWTREDCADLVSLIRKNEIKVVIHKWIPSKPILAAIREAGSRLVVLQTMDPPSQTDVEYEQSNYARIMQQNLRSMYEAFSEPALGATK